jgi:6-phosphogluconolactonase
MIARLPCWFFTVIAWFGLTAAAHAADTLVYFGTTGEKQTSQGIYVSRFDPKTGALSPATLAAKIENPLFLNLHPNQPILYSIGERKNNDGKVFGTIEAFTIDRATGLLTPLNHQIAGDDALCYVAIDKTARTALGVSYRKGYVVSFPVNPDGTLGERTSFIQHTGSSVHESQKGPHAHCIDLDPANGFALVADLGLDQVITYKLDAAKSTLAQQPAPFITKPGAGPRHLAFDASGKHVYIVNEIGNTLTLADYDSKTGRLTEKQTLPLLPPDFKGESTAAEVVVHPSGKFLYASNRGHDAPAAFCHRSNRELAALRQPRCRLDNRLSYRTSPWTSDRAQHHHQSSHAHLYPVSGAVRQPRLR